MSVHVPRIGWVSCLALALASCGGDPVPVARRADAMASDASTAVGDAAAGETIAGIVAASPDFSMLLAAAERAGLMDMLAGPGTYTVFAPTNGAFAASGITRAMITSMRVEELAAILRYHVLATEVSSDAITAGPVTTVSMLTMFLGTTDGVAINGGNTVIGGANVVTADIEAINGVVHAVDRVLLPPNVLALARYGGLTSLVSALTDARLVDDLSATGPFTVFAPTNDAFAALETAPTGDALEQVLRHHVAPGSLASSTLPPRAASLARSAYADPLSLLFDGTDGVTVDGRSRVVLADLRATNGIVHVVDEVLLPMNVVEALIAAGLTGFIGAEASAAELPDGTSIFETLATPGPYTIFAPSNAAFTTASAVMETLSPVELRDVLLHHVLAPSTFRYPVLAGDLPSSVMSLPTLDAASSIPFAPGPPPTVGGAEIVIADIVATNGVIHVIEAVMVP